MGDSVHSGPPTWDGQKRDLDLTVAYCPSILGVPFTTLIEGTDDHFVMLFRTEEALRRHMGNPVMQRVLLASFGVAPLAVIRVEDINAFCTAIWQAGARIMLDPEIVSAHHTRWQEVVRDGDIIRYVTPK